MIKIQILVKIIFINFLASPLETYVFQLDTVNSFDKILGLSVTEIAKNYYLKNSSHLNMIHSIKKGNHYKFIDVMDTLIFTFKSDETTFQIEDSETIHQTIDTKRSSNMLFIDSVKSFKKILKVLNSAYFKVGKVITIISIKELTISEMEMIFSLLFKQNLVSVNILSTNIARTVNLYTFFPFKDYSNCKDTTPIIISTFDINSLKWSNSNNFYNRKTNNLMSCPIRIGAAAVSSEPGIMSRKLENGELEIYGVEKDIFDEFSTKINFTIDYVPYFNGVGSVYPNGTGFGVLGNVLNNDIDIGIGFVSLQYTRTLFLGVSHYYRIDTLMLVGKHKILIFQRIKQFGNEQKMLIYSSTW